jgi:photosystem II stability/assembly factor-like uncharacterized protein
MRPFILFVFSFITCSLFAQEPEVFSFPTISKIYNIYSISVVNDDVVWAVANRNDDNAASNSPKYFRTSDGGKSWKVASIPIAGRICYDIQGLDSLTAIVTSNKLQSTDTRPIFKTTDGGLTWNSIQPTGNSGGVNIHFFNETEGMVFNNGKYAVSSDKGGTWTNFIQLPFGANEYNGFIGGTTNLTYADENTFMIGSSEGRIFITRDKAKTWKTIQAAKNNELINSITFFDALNGALIVTGTSSTNYLKSKIYITSDGGDTWKFSQEYDSFITSIHAVKNTSYVGNAEKADLLYTNKDRVNSENWEIAFDSYYRFYGGQTSKNGITYLAVKDETNVTQILKINNSISYNKEIGKIEVVAYPNPCVDKLFISTDNNQSLHYNIFDLSGRMKLQGKLTKDFINTGALSNGIYFLQLMDEYSKNAVFNKAVIVSK